MLGLDADVGGDKDHARVYRRSRITAASSARRWIPDSGEHALEVRAHRLGAEHQTTAASAFVIPRAASSATSSSRSVRSVTRSSPSPRDRAVTAPRRRARSTERRYDAARCGRIRSSTWRSASVKSPRSRLRAIPMIDGCAVARTRADDRPRAVCRSRCRSPASAARASSGSRRTAPAPVAGLRHVPDQRVLTRQSDECLGEVGEQRLGRVGDRRTGSWSRFTSLYDTWSQATSRRTSRERDDG